MKPFHEWKAEQYAKDQAAGTPHTREWYYAAYGGYCNRMRQQVKPHIAKRSILPEIPLGWGVWHSYRNRKMGFAPVMSATTLPALKACYSGWPKVNKEK